MSSNQIGGFFSTRYFLPTLSIVLYNGFVPFRHLTNIPSQTV